ncbi:MAG TPA: UDP-3-O-(3-hydroxymyristoyl)glucosamine N-acyltransferase [Pyrinomonadaceae bacterium]|nr:UDP-3-O-(3-hydroxymyristoyl)glucosamine N-acyltransferase [Pyrinomonadaceae bacterium]
MNSKKERTVADLAAHVGGRVLGDGSLLIKGVASVEQAQEGEIAFVDEDRFLESARESRASCLIVPEGARVDAKCVIEAARPKLAFALIAELLHPPKRQEPAVHPTAVLAASAKVDESAFIGAYVRVGKAAVIGQGTQVHAGAIIGDGVRVGRDCVIHPNVVLYAGVCLGDRVILHACVVVGADGFGYVRGESGYHKFPQIGTVLIEDDVEIGAHTCIDRGALGRTRIGRGTKIDNLVQVAHNVEIGERVVIAAQTGISGSTVIEDDAVIGGQVGMGDHARVQSGAVIGSKAGILPGKIVRAGVWWGIPVQPLNEYKRLNAHLSRLPQMREEIKELHKQVEELKARMEKGEGEK